MINVVFDDFKERSNLRNFNELTSSGLHKLGWSPLVGSMSHYCGDFVFSYNSKDSNKLSHYIYAIGVQTRPEDWAHTETKTQPSLFALLSKERLADIKNKKCLLVIDSSFEGYTSDWLWAWFHRKTDIFQIDPTSIVYTSSNALDPALYKDWADKNNVEKRIKVLCFEYFELDIHNKAKQSKANVSWDNIIEFKKSNLDKIKTFNCLNKRPRTHRIWFFTKLVKEKLLDKGLVSLHQWPEHVYPIDGEKLSKEDIDLAIKFTPLNLYDDNPLGKDDGFYIERLIPQLYLDSWISVITEPFFDESQNSTMLSEKIFKPIANKHPFIIVGGKNSLQRLRDIGYKTFNGWIDERYDTMTSHNRMNAIITSIRQFEHVEDKLTWYRSMKDVLEFNYNKLMNYKLGSSTTVKELTQYYKQYFNC